MQVISGLIHGAQKVVIYGAEGIGKSTFASKFPSPLFIDTEGSTKRLDVQRLQRPSSWTMLLEQVKYFKTSLTGTYKTLVIDTADWAERLCIEHICAKGTKDGPVDGLEGFGYGKGYVYLVEEFGRLLNLLEELIERGVHVVMTAHAQVSRFEQPNEIGSYDRWEMKLQKKTAPLVKEWADMVLFANYKTVVVNVDNQGAQKGKNKAQGGRRVMYTAHHPCWDAKNRHSLDMELDFDYAKIALCMDPSVPDTTKSAPTSSPAVTQGAPSSKMPEPQHAEQGPRYTPPPEINISPQAPEPEATKPPEPSPAPPVASPLLPKGLLDLMSANGVLVQEIQMAVADKGYYPVDTPIENYDPGFIDGVLIGAWPKVFSLVQKIRKEMPF